MTREEAINEIKSWDFLEGKEIEAIQTLVPELSESEDERIREWLVYYFKAIGKSWLHHRDISIEQILAYLEKQKEPHKRLRDKTPWIVTAKEELAHDEERLQANLEELHRIRAEKEKQKEQKPVQDKEEKEYVRTLKSLIADFLHGKNEIDRGYYQKIYDWLDGRHIKQEPAWSEEDEKMLDSIIRVVCGVGIQPNGLREKQVSFLKSLRPSWKPSEEQMEALHTAMYLEEMQFYGGLKDKLRDLYVQLKKL